ncbi:hypothetical protein BDW74DRAFT_49685 [Aspergillus multicolor]|uniref:SET domain-containing protein n=1 Tax=Aspergillus multicolor TaxID=41759 RepID=UPI003CCD6CAB
MIERLGVPHPSEMSGISPSDLPTELAHLSLEQLQLPLINEHFGGTIPKDNKDWHSLEIAHDQLVAVNMNRVQGLGCDISEPIASGIFEKRWISDQVGYGLVATKYTPTGTTVFADVPITMWSHEWKKSKSFEESNKMVLQKAAGMGPMWNKEFLALAEGRKHKHFVLKKRNTGVGSAIWDDFALPLAWEGKVGEVLGLNLARVNHSCIPNCIVRYRNQYPKSKAGEVLYDRRPKLEAVVVRACDDIQPGTEITIAYLQSNGCTKTRRAEIMERHSFNCICRICTMPHAAADKAMGYFRRCKILMENPDMITNRPAFTYLNASLLVDHLAGIRIQDNRAADIWMKCALIAGHHTDLARAWCFLRKAREAYLLLEGLSGGEYRRVEGWYRDLTSMPGFGATQRGLSPRMQAFPIFSDGVMPRRMLFMLDAPRDGYITVDRYHPLPRSDDDGEPLFEIVKGPDRAPEPLAVNAKGPANMCRCHKSCKTVAARLNRVRKQRRRRGKSQRKGTVQNQGSECVDPEHDFLDGVMKMGAETFGQAAVDEELDRDDVCVCQIFGPRDDDQPSLGKAGVSSDRSHNHDEAEVEQRLRARDEESNEHTEGAQVQNGDEAQEKKNNLKGNGLKENGQKKGKQPLASDVEATMPVVKNVGAEKKPQIVKMEDFVYCDAGVEYR